MKGTKTRNMHTHIYGERDTGEKEPSEPSGVTTFNCGHLESVSRLFSAAASISIQSSTKFNNSNADKPETSRERKQKGRK